MFVFRSVFPVRVIDLIPDEYTAPEHPAAEDTCPKCGTQYSLYRYADGNRWSSSNGKQYDTDTYTRPVSKSYCADCCDRAIRLAPELMFDFLNDHDALDEVIAEYFGLSDSVESDYKRCAEFVRVAVEAGDDDMNAAMQEVMDNYKESQIVNWLFSK